jgi:hypothetical protein
MCYQSMPPCKNDSSRRYAGNEPSPKGLGMCAHAEQPWAVAKGLNGKTWFVSVSSKGVKAWKPLGGKPVKTITWDFGKHPIVLKNKAALWPTVTSVRLRVFLDDYEPFEMRGDLTVRHPPFKGSIYDSDAWVKALLKELAKAAKSAKLPPADFSFSEMGMQTNTSAHLDVYSDSVKALLKTHL